MLCASLLGLQGTPARAQPACRTLAAETAAQLPVSGFLASWPDSQAPTLRGAAFTYDNALAVLALTACGEPALARRIATALLYAQEHDRFWHDGRLRNGYAAGASGSGTARLAGWWSVERSRWLEDGYQAGSDSGNQAFALLALLAAADHSPDPAFLRGATRLATHLLERYDAHGAPGFTGGLAGHEPQPRVATWKSTEHNIDLYAAFSMLAARSGDPRWPQAATRARDFVESMWRADCGCFAAGTLADGVTPNTLRALDAQVLPLLALPDATKRYAAALGTIMTRLAAADGGFRYSDAPGALWVEGTAQMALLMRTRGQAAEADALLARIATQRDARGRFYASAPGGTGTGFALEEKPGVQRIYAHEPHLAALCWVAMAEQSFDPLALKSRTQRAP